MSLYQALANLSLPRPGDVNRETDLVIAGETVDLTDEQAALFLPPRRQPALIRLSKEAGQPLPRLLPRLLSGVAVNPRTGQRIGHPGPPLDARPDPAGSSVIQVMEVPEAHEPQPDSENQPAPGEEVNAVDLPPRSRRGAAATPKAR